MFQITGGNSECSDGIPSFIQRKAEVSCNWVDSSSSLAVAVSRHANKLVSTRRTRSSKLSPSLPPIYPFYYMPRCSSPVSRALGSSDSIAKRVEDQLMIRSCRNEHKPSLQPPLPLIHPWARHSISCRNCHTMFYQRSVTNITVTAISHSFAAFRVSNHHPPIYTIPSHHESPLCHHRRLALHRQSTFCDIAVYLDHIADCGEWEGMHMRWRQRWGVGT